MTTGAILVPVPHPESPQDFVLPVRTRFLYARTIIVAVILVVVVALWIPFAIDRAAINQQYSMGASLVLLLILCVIGYVASGSAVLARRGWLLRATAYGLQVYQDREVVTVPWHCVRGVGIHRPEVIRIDLHPSAAEPDSGLHLRRDDPTRRRTLVVVGLRIKCRLTPMSADQVLSRLYAFAPESP